MIWTYDRARKLKPYKRLSKTIEFPDTFPKKEKIELRPKVEKVAPEEFISIRKISTGKTYKTIAIGGNDYILPRINIIVPIISMGLISFTHPDFRVTLSMEAKAEGAGSNHNRYYADFEVVSSLSATWWQSYPEGITSGDAWEIGQDWGTFSLDITKYCLSHLSNLPKIRWYAYPEFDASEWRKTPEIRNLTVFVSGYYQDEIHREIS